VTDVLAADTTSGVYGLHIFDEESAD